VRVPGDGPVDAPGAQLGEGAPLAGVVLADVDGELVNQVGVAGEEGFEPAAGADGAELAVVADHDQLRLRLRDGGEEPGEVGVIRHARLIEDHHMAG